MTFHLGRIPIEVQPSFFILAVLLAFSRLNEPVLLLSWVVVVFVSVLLHELGHAVAFRTFGHTPRITLYAMGGLTHGSPGRPLTAARSVAVSLAGPIAGFIAGGAVWLATRDVQELPPLASAVLHDWLFVNIGWGIFNLLPMLPLDGGQALQGGLQIVAPRRAEWITLIVSLVTAGLIVAIALYVGMLWVGFLGAFFAIGSFKRLQELRGGGGGSSRASGLGVAPDGGSASEAESLVTSGDLEGAFRLLDSRRGGALDDHTHAAIETALYHAGRYEQAFSASAIRFERHGRPDAAYNAACSLLKLGRQDEAMSWLAHAADAGYRDADHLEADDDLADLRGRDDFRALVQHVRG